MFPGVLKGLHDRMNNSLSLKAFKNSTQTRFYFFYIIQLSVFLDNPNLS